MLISMSLNVIPLRKFVRELLDYLSDVFGIKSHTSN